jgi:hypothetical protein
MQVSLTPMLLIIETGGCFFDRKFEGLQSTHGVSARSAQEFSHQVDVIKLPDSAIHALQQQHVQGPQTKPQGSLTSELIQQMEA